MQQDLEPLNAKQIEELILDAYQSCQAQNMQTLRSLVAGMTHEFNNVLTGILGTIELAQMKPDAQEKEDMLESACEQGFHAAEIIKQITLFSRQAASDKKHVELNELLKIITKINRFILSKHIGLDFIASTDPLHIWANTSQIQQILLNLIHHAADTLKNTDDATITIQPHHFEANPSFTQAYPTLSATAFARIDVQDNSEGITKESIGEIFKPRLSNNPNDEDTSLGLVAAYAIAQEHGGIIEVESSKGKGTCFSIYLPLIDHAKSA